MVHIGTQHFENASVPLCEEHLVTWLGDGVTLQIIQSSRTCCRREPMLLEGGLR